MRIGILRQKAGIRLRNEEFLFAFLLVFCVFFFGCRQPVFESEECQASRDTVKRFYSFHLGNDMAPSAKNFERRKKYLSEKLLKTLGKPNDSATDYFTQTDNYPKAFRAGKCMTTANDSASFEILLFWRDDDKDTQREISVEAVKENDSWLINRVSRAK